MLVRVQGLAGVRAVAAGGRHDLALLSNGTVAAWGDDTFGQLGNGSSSSNADSEIPALVKGLTRVTAIAAGEEHSLALLADGSVVAWGDNRAGQLGDGTQTNSDVPVRVTGLTGVRAIAAGGQHAPALLSNGTMMSWGGNENDQLGDGMDSSVQPSSDVPVAVVHLARVRAIAAGFEHSVALTADGAVHVCGGNGFFQLARPNGFPGGVSASDVPLTVPGVRKATAIAAGAVVLAGCGGWREGEGLGRQRVRPAR